MNRGRKKYDLFFDKDGFQVSSTSTDIYELSNMYLANAYYNKTLLSVEIYEAKEIAINTIFQREKDTLIYWKRNKTADFTELSDKNVKSKQLNLVKDGISTFRKYFNSKKFIYILTAVSKDGENQTVRHFFDSLRFSANQTQIIADNSIPISKLKLSNIEIITKDVPSFDPKENDLPSDTTIEKEVIGWKPFPSFVAAARGTSGKIRLRCTLNENGFISKIEFINLLPNGLSRQVLFATLRIKFIPQEKNGYPIQSQKVFEYNFSSR